MVRAAERVLARLPEGAPETVRARLLASVAVESRGDALAEGALPAPPTRPAAPRTLAPPRQQARRRGRVGSRRLHDASLLAFALNGTFLQSFRPLRPGRPPRRDRRRTGPLARTHGLLGPEVLGRLIRVQAPRRPRRPARRRPPGHRRRPPRRPLRTPPRPRLHHLVPRPAHHPGHPRRPDRHRGRRGHRGRLRRGRRPPPHLRNARLSPSGLPALTRLAPVVRAGALPAPEAFTEADWGPYDPWVRPLLLLGDARPDEASEALRTAPRPPHDLMAEPMWCLLARAAALAGDPVLAARAAAALGPAEDQQAGAASGLLTFARWRRTWRRTGRRRADSRPRPQGVPGRPVSLTPPRRRSPAPSGRGRRGARPAGPRRPRRDGRGHALSAAARGSDRASTPDDGPRRPTRLLLRSDTSVRTADARRVVRATGRGSRAAASRARGTPPVERHHPPGPYPSSRSRRPPARVCPRLHHPPVLPGDRHQVPFPHRLRRHEPRHTTGHGPGIGSTRIRLQLLLGNRNCRSPSGTAATLRKAPSTSSSTS